MLTTGAIRAFPRTELSTAEGKQGPFRTVCRFRHRYAPLVLAGLPPAAHSAGTQRTRMGGRCQTEYSVRASAMTLWAARS